MRLCCCGDDVAAPPTELLTASDTAGDSCSALSESSGCWEAEADEDSIGLDVDRCVRLGDDVTPSAATGGGCVVGDDIDGADEVAGALFCEGGEETVGWIVAFADGVGGATAAAAAAA
jgi:hypothetical protein